MRNPRDNSVTHARRRDDSARASQAITAACADGEVTPRNEHLQEWLVRLGAPSWFDLLSRFVNIRAAGKPPGEKEPSSTPTRPPPASIDTTPGTHSPRTMNPSIPRCYGR